jgi:putative copper resistance protein D
VGLAASNRLLLTPALERSLRSGEPSAPAVTALRRSVFAETLAAGAVLALVAWLGTLAPIREF